jgi:Ran GTPase-activating protein (RanGAP) involved in mRNA processing and transport
MREQIVATINGVKNNRLNLSNLQIVDDELPAILSLVKHKFPEISMIRLAKNQITDKGAHILEYELSKLTQLTVLDLQMNQLGEEGIRALFNLSFQTNPPIELSLHGNKLNDASKILYIKNECSPTGIKFPS